MKPKNDVNFDSEVKQDKRKKTEVKPQSPRPLPDSKQIIINTQCDAADAIAQELSKFLQKITLPVDIVVASAPTVGVSVEVEITDRDGNYSGKKMIVSASRTLGESETMDQGHAKLFIECINSLDKLI